MEQLPEKMDVSVVARPRGADVVVSTGSGKEILTSEPPEMGGTGQGPTPLEVFAAGLAACEAAMFQLVAQRAGARLEHVEVAVEADFGFGDGLRSMRITYRVRGPSREEAERLLRYVQRLCPLYNTVSKSGARVEEELVVE